MPHVYQYPQVRQIQHPHLEAAQRRARLAASTRGDYARQHARMALAHLSQHQQDSPNSIGPDFEIELHAILNRR